MSASERRKGARGEREVAAVLRAHGLPVDRTVQQSGIYLRGDLTGVPGYHFEVKRQEALRLPLWLRQAEADALPATKCLACEGMGHVIAESGTLARCDQCGGRGATGGDVPVVTFRQNQGRWYATLPLDDLAKLLDLARLSP
jgi:hypothetical protein